MAGAGGREVGRVSVRVVPDTDGFRRSLKRQLEAITKGLEAKVNVVPDLDGFRQKVNAATKGMDAHIQVHADTARARAEMLALQKSGGRGGIFSTLGASISEMTQSMGQSIATARPFGVSIVAIAAAASLAVPAIGLMSGALVALPGILSAIVAPLGAVLMGMEGIKQSLVNSGWAVFDKKGKLKPGEQLAKIQDSVSKVFETGLTPVFTKLLAIIPALQEGFGAIAQGLVGMTDGFVSALTSAKGLDQIKTMFKNIGDALGQASPGIQDFTAAMLTLSTEFSKKLPGMAQSFNNWASKVLTWVDKITTKGPDGLSQFDKAMSGLGDSLKSFGSGIGDLFLKGFDWISNPENPKKVVSFINDLKTAIDGLWPILDKTFTRLEQLMKTAAPLIKTAGALSELTGQNKTGSNFKAPGEGSDGGSTGQKAWDGFKNGFLQAFDPAWLGNKITEMFNSVPWSSVWQGLKDSWNAVLGFFQGSVSFFANLWGSIQSAATSAWNGIVSAVSSAITNVVSAIVSGGSQIMAEVGSWPGKIQSFFADAGSWLIAAGQQLVQGFINGMSDMIGAAVAKAREFASRVKNAVTDFLGIHSPSRVMHDLGQYTGQGFADGLESQKEKITNVAADIAKSVKDQFGIDLPALGQKGLDTAFGFGEANGRQLMSDLGMGGGALTALADQGLQFGKQALGQALTQNFFTSNVDDTIAVKNNQLNKQALGVVGKSK
ncbi:Phage-related protein [Mycobacteroides abscessus subsp. abscessus]|uniref:phage tail protein n=1 Tax=Mycobacteroides abscessus TaxID=36809 RepID=UPI0009295D9D|nr:Phage-related protein [Mycobacteroides abscessus subsp. abscessus]